MFYAIHFQKPSFPCGDNQYGYYAGNDIQIDKEALDTVVLSVRMHAAQEIVHPEIRH